MRGKETSDARMQKALAAYQAGEPARAIGQRLKIKPQVIYRAAARKGVKRPNGTKRRKGNGTATATPATPETEPLPNLPEDAEPCIAKLAQRADDLRFAELTVSGVTTLGAAMQVIALLNPQAIVRRASHH